MIRNNIFQIILMIAISIIPIMSIHLPRALSFSPLLIGLIMSIWWIFIKKEKIQYSKNYAFIIIGICFLCFISVAWSINQSEALDKVIKLLAILLFSIPLFNLMRSIDINIIEKKLWIFPVGVSIAAILCSYELANELPLYQIIHNVGIDYEVNTAVMNRGVVSTILAYFVAFLFIDHMNNTAKIKLIIITIMSISVLFMLYLTQSQSAQLAFIVGIFALLIFPHKFKHSYILLASIIISFIIATPWIIDILYIYLMENAQEIPWLQDGYAGNRIEIWNFVMNYALQNPLYGYGIEATRFVTEFKHEYIYHKGATILHPHNFSIQIWIEFGIIGIISISAFIIFLLQQIKRLEINDRRSITAVFLATLSISAMGYGLWQSWWIGLFIFISALCALVSKKRIE